MLYGWLELKPELCVVLQDQLSSLGLTEPSPSLTPFPRGCVYVVMMHQIYTINKKNKFKLPSSAFTTQVLAQAEEVSWSQR